MKREELENGMIRLSSEKGIEDRNGTVYSEVVCKPENEAKYKEAENEEQNP